MTWGLTPNPSTDLLPCTILLPSTSQAQPKTMRESQGRKLIGGGAEASLCAPYPYLVFWRERHKLSHVSTGSAGFCMEELASEFKALSHAGR